MCLVAFAINACARWPLVLASNRDEYFERPSLPLARWQTASGKTIISGRDLRAGGTWLGMTPGGRIALLTNVRELAPAMQIPTPRSRGELVLRWLESDIDATRFMLQTDPAAYGGFNVVVGDYQTDSWTWLSNRLFDSGMAGPAAARPTGHGWCSRALEPGVYGLSNAALDAPWPKTLALKAALDTALADAVDGTGPGTLEMPLWNALASRQRADPQSLPDTGLPATLEAALSSAFVDSPERGYGTRCSTLLLAGAADMADERWTIRVHEKTYANLSRCDQRPDPQIEKVVSHMFHWRKNRVQP